LGRHSKSTRNRIARRLPVAAPAVAGIAAAVCLSPAVAFASTAIPAGPGANSYHSGASLAELHGTTTGWASTQLDAKTKPVVKSAPRAKAKSAQTVYYTVQSGDSLSTIAGRYYQNEAAWTAIYWANHSQLASPNLIEVGQRLAIPPKPATIPAAPAMPAPPVSTPAPATSTNTASTETPAYTQPTYSQPTYSQPAYSSDASTSGDSSFQQCVIERESGGNSQVMNSSGHYGLYQFSASTWAAYGGNPADFGNASASEQNQVFDNAIAQGGQGNWSAYDGC